MRWLYRLGNWKHHMRSMQIFKILPQHRPAETASRHHSHTVNIPELMHRQENFAFLFLSMGMHHTLVMCGVRV